MWTDVIIGTGTSGCSAIKVFLKDEDNHDIAENARAFWISDAYLGLGMTIFKDTPQGKKLTKFIENKTDYATIKTWIENTLISRVDVDKLKGAIRFKSDEQFENGFRAAQENIRNALGMR